VAVAFRPLVQGEPMVVNLEQEHSGSMAERQQSVVGMAMLHAVPVPAVEVRSQQAEQHSCLTLALVRMGSEHQLGVQTEEKSSGEGLEEDPLEEVEVSTLLLARMDLEVGLRGAAAGSGTEKLQCS